MLNQFFVSLVIFVSSIFAAYLENVPQSIVQPDGTVIESFSSGDEFYNWVHDKDGYTIVRGDDGFCYYANQNLEATDYRVGEISPKDLNLPKWIKIKEEDYINKKKAYLSNAENRTPTTGIVNNLNVFIRFADEPEFSGSFESYDDPFNLEEGPSMRHYFHEVSYGTLDAPTTHFPTPNQGMIISYQDQYPRSYYQPYNAQTNPNGYTNDSGQREHILLKNAIEFIEDQVPMDLVIDGDNDGNVDNVTFLVYGSPGAWADLLWPHRWVLWYEDAYIHGKQVWDYNFNLATGGYFTVGTLCHEFNHSLGAPDLYHYYSDGPVACGGWDVMDSSNDTPQYMGAFMKAKYGHWIDDVNGDGQNNEYDIPLLTEPGVYEINPLDQSTNYAYRIPSPYTNNQYFIVEYRRKQGLYEIYTPGNDDGLLVYRINTCCGGNADGPPDEVYIYRPNGDANTNGNLGLAIFNQETGRDKINDQTNPSAFLYPNWTAPGCDDADGCEGGLFIKNIGNPNETISFEYFPIFLNADFYSISNDSDGDGVLNPGEEATLNFMLENTSTDSFAYAINVDMLESEYFEVLSDSIFIEELHGDQISPLISFDIRINNGVSIGMIEAQLNINATVYEQNIGDFDYNDTLTYNIEISMNQSGFPFETADEVKSSPAVFDLDQDGDNEIIFGDSSGMLYILNHDMSIYNSYDVGDEIWGAPAIDDFDNDGNYEIAVTSKNGFFYIFDYMGNMVYDYDTEEYLLGSPSVGWHNGFIPEDDSKRIIVPTYSSDGKILSFSYNTGAAELISFEVNKKIKKGVALYDFDNNGDVDCVYGTDSNTLEVAMYNEWNGYEITNIFEVGGKIQSAPVIIKFNDNEFLIVAGSKDDNLYAFNPILGTEQFVYETGDDVHSPSVFEHNEYGPVIVFGSDDGHLYMVDTNGNDIPGWPKDLGGQVEGSAAISDLDGDGLVDVVVGNSQGKLYAFNENGQLLVDFPLIIEFPYASSPVIADLDNDGDLEILLGGSDGLYGYDFSNQNGSSIGFWSMYRGNHKRTGAFESVSYLSSDLSEVPDQFNISSVYPNPFNPTTSISVDVSNNEQFKLSVYDIKGALIQEIFSGSKPVGSYQFDWDASAYSSGIYLVNISSKNFYNNYKIMLIK